MPRVRQIGKYGNSWVIKLKPIDAIDLEFDETSWVDIEDLVILKKEGEVEE